MKRITAFVSFVLLAAVCSAQSLSVGSFKLLETDLTANTKGTMETDQNGNVAALIKVVTSETGFTFDGGMMGVVKTEQKTGEIWLYVPYGLQKLTIAHQQLGVLRDYVFPVSIEKGRTYELKLVSGQIQTTVIKAQTAQYVVFSVYPSTATVTIDDVSHSLNSEGQLSVRLPFGDHTYKIEAPSYAKEDGIFSVGQEKSKITVNLKSLMAELTVKTDSEAEIWVNDEKMAAGLWTGELVPGNYMVEARKESHRTVMQEIVLQQQEQKSIELAAPTPITGSLQIESEPLECYIFIDGKQVGETPSFIDDCLIGEHKVELKKDGYETKELTVSVKENETSSIDVELNKVEVVSNQSNADDVPIAVYDEIEIVENKIYDNIEDMPEYPGGQAACMKYIGSHYEYPKECRVYNIQGTVVVQFVVEKNGSIDNIEVIKSVHPLMDAEAIRVIETMPHWNPGKIRGTPVRVLYKMPIYFKLDQL